MDDCSMASQVQSKLHRPYNKGDRFPVQSGPIPDQERDWWGRFPVFGIGDWIRGRNMFETPPPPVMQTAMLIIQDPPKKVVLRKWTTGLCGCCEDPSNCIVTCCCPCVTFGQNAEIIDEGATSCFVGGLVYYFVTFSGIGCLYTCTYREKLRYAHSLQEDPCADCLVHWCCFRCALCQEYRELKNRGFDPSIGWAANAEKMNQGAVTMLPVMPGMGR
ncbi:protein PLANT CADMIUM RESISTANCE 3-like [Rhodamnia argentea]|uniref:Protein PLANT CADMIUM RESISTANCE 3-like n=1 Tax=Rhodamnia argentea TaxID=178133 RepID=A0ABM3HJ05_9MYRT|nr:protein PLANT CADMIUM RESISTANCE 3-like [Rhodamnia argentea]